MTSKVFISELHDIGKLVDQEALKKLGITCKGHTYGNFDFTQTGFTKNDKPTSSTWYLQHTVKDFFKVDINSEAYLTIPDTQSRANFLLSTIADGRAATVTRIDGRDRGKVGQGVHKLWNPYKEKIEKWAAFTDIPSLRGMFKYIDSCKSHKEFFKDFEEELEQTPEDKAAPRNIVTLYTHLELSGKIFRVLQKHTHLDVQDTQNVLVYKFLKAGYMEHWKYNATYSGTPQGGIISPLLANIYLHELDKFVMMTLKTEFDKPIKQRLTKQYNCIQHKTYKLKKLINSTSGTERLKFIDKYKSLRKELLKTPYTPQTDKKIVYQRYADDFLVGINGNRKECLQIKSRP